MKVYIKVKPNAKEDKVIAQGDNQFLVRVKAPAKNNKANQAVIRILAEYFAVTKSQITLLKGSCGRQKICEVDK